MICPSVEDEPRHDQTICQIFQACNPLISSTNHRSRSQGVTKQACTWIPAQNMQLEPDNRQQIQSYQCNQYSLLPASLHRQIRQIPIPPNLHSSRESKEATMVGSHILCNTTRPIELLQLTLRTRAATKIVEPSDHLEHGRECDLADAHAQALMGSIAKVDVGVRVTVESNFVWVGECNGIPGCGYLKEEGKCEMLLFGKSRAGDGCVGVASRGLPDCTGSLDRPSTPLFRHCLRRPWARRLVGAEPQTIVIALLP